jgi:hypothetical protein
MLAHNGRTVPRFREGWDSRDIGWVRFVWDAQINGAQITDSVWTLPVEWTSLEEAFSVDFKNASGGVFHEVTQVRVSCAGAPPGVYLFTNRVAFGSGATAGVLERSVEIEVIEL